MELEEENWQPSECALPALLCGKEETNEERTATS